MISLNDVFKHDFKFSQQDVCAFAEVTGDKNPIHLDANYAASTMFKKPIMHGMLGACVFSKVFGVLFPGEGTIYLKQSLVFLKPMYVGVDYEAVLTIKEILPKNKAIVDTKILEKETEMVCISGEATVLNTLLILTQ